MDRKGLRRAERDLYDYIATKPVEVLVQDERDVVIKPLELSWEQRALIAEDKLQALVDSLESEETWQEALLYNPLVVAVASRVVQYHLAEDDRLERLALGYDTRTTRTGV